ncbi:MAG: hypothetical protein U0X20_07955 [Caldilineaceae bacterium]
MQGIMPAKLEIAGTSTDLAVEDCGDFVQVAITFDGTLSIYLTAEEVLQLRDWLDTWLQEHSFPQTGGA